MPRAEDPGADGTSAAHGRLRIDPAGADPAPWKRGTEEVDVGARSPALVMVPDTDPSRRLPLLVFLHGAGGDGRQSIGLIGPGAARRDLVVVAPTSDGHTWDQLARGFGPDVAALGSTLQTVLRRRPVDTSRIAIGGFSDGASYALSIGLANGDVFSHVLALSPGFAAPPTHVGAPSVFVSHGVDDSVLPIAATSRRVVPMLEHAGYAVRYEEFDGDHGVPPVIVDRALDHFLGTGHHEDA